MLQARASARTPGQRPPRRVRQCPASASCLLFLALLLCAVTVCAQPQVLEAKPSPPASTSRGEAPPAQAPPDDPLLDFPPEDVGAAPQISASHAHAHNHAPAHEEKEDGAGLPYEVPRAAEAAWWDARASFGGPENAFMRRALAAGALAALACGFVGVFVVLKRIVFVGVALAEVSSAGIALALLQGFPPLSGALAATLGGTLLFASRPASKRVPAESPIGVVYSLAGAAAILLIARNPGGESHMLKLLQGDVLTVEASETWQMAGCYALLGIVHALFAKEFTLTSFDREGASALGLRASAWEALLMVTIGAAIAFAIRAVGVLLCSALLVMPAAAALLMCRRLGSTLVLAPLLALASVALGLHFSFVLDVPASALSVAVLFAILALASLRFALRAALRRA